MKGGNLHKMRWRQLTLPLIALLFTFVFLLIWEKNPFLTTFFSAQEQPMMIFSDIVQSSPNDYSMDKNSTDHIEDVSLTFENEETEADTIIQSSDAGLLNFTASESPLKNDDNLVKTSSSKKEDCNYGKGRWVEDNRRPLYSGFGCKQWLSQMWACRLTQRTDFSYEKYKWQPMNCSMPEFEGSAFLKRMQDKTLAFVGDSLGRQQFQSLMCMISSNKSHLKVQDVGSEYGLIKVHGATRPDGWAYKFLASNTTILYYWSASLCAIEPIDPDNPSTDFAMHLDRPPAFLVRFLPRFHVVILNTGHHWNRGKLNANRWVMYADGRPVGNRKLAQVNNAKGLAIRSVVRWVDSRIPFHPGLRVFFRTLSPRHFFHGDWNTGGSCDSTSPLARGSEVLGNGSSDPVVEDAVRGTRVRVLDITALSELRDEGHISRYSVKATQGVQDCLHWCLPGIPDTWNELLFAQL